MQFLVLKLKLFQFAFLINILNCLCKEKLTYLIIHEKIAEESSFVSRLESDVFEISVFNSDLFYFGLRR